MIAGKKMGGKNGVSALIFLPLKPFPMPITRTTETIRPTQSEFGQIAYDVMNCVYEIHHEFGRFFDEAVYKRELAGRLPSMELELPVTVTHGTF